MKKSNSEQFTQQQSYNEFLYLVQQVEVIFKIENKHKQPKIYKVQSESGF